MEDWGPKEEDGLAKFLQFYSGRCPGAYLLYNELRWPLNLERIEKVRRKPAAQMARKLVECLRFEREGKQEGRLGDILKAAAKLVHKQKMIAARSRIGSTRVEVHSSRITFSRFTFHSQSRRNT